MDLVKANASGTPDWVQLIDYVQDYDMGEGISPDALYELAVRMTEDQNFLWRWKWNESRNKGDLKTGSEKDFVKDSTKSYC